MFSLGGMMGPNRRNFHLHLSILSMPPLKVFPQICGARDVVGWVSRSISAMVSLKSTLSGIVSTAATLLVRLSKVLGRGKDAASCRCRDDSVGRHRVSQTALTTPITSNQRTHEYAMILAGAVARPTLGLYSTYL